MHFLDVVNGWQKQVQMLSRLRPFMFVVRRSLATGQASAPDVRHLCLPTLGRLRILTLIRPAIELLLELLVPVEVPHRRVVWVLEHLPIVESPLHPWSSYYSGKTITGCGWRPTDCGVLASIPVAIELVWISNISSLLIDYMGFGGELRA